MQLKAAMTKLRKMLATERDIARIIEFFLNHIASKEFVLRQGVPFEDADVLKMAIKLSLGNFFGEPVKLECFSPCYLKRHKLVHGSFIVKNRLGMFLYFDDDPLAVFTLAPIARGNTEFFRFNIHDLKALPIDLLGAMVVKGVDERQVH
ncbi:MAG: hypothetical protein CMF50_00775 [Legionellales bacterium]|nr:hypothetical protein [Legionellales bacterium]|tara:strand:- start:51528 stop:51974 length:447 start_codon:yes stop_codon:yes gene_type:complete